MSQFFVLAKYGPKIELVRGSFGPKTMSGERFLRMPSTEQEGWTIIRTFNEEEQEQLSALATLAGTSTVRKLFQCELPSEN